MVFSAEASGRVLRYNPTTEETIVLVKNVQFPNGISLSRDGSFLVFSEGAVGRLGIVLIDAIHDPILFLLQQIVSKAGHRKY